MPAVVLIERDPHNFARSDPILQRRPEIPAFGFAKRT
jgi:hypothetical protein